jgi:hypothetical protein
MREGKSAKEQRRGGSESVEGARAWRERERGGSESVEGAGAFRPLNPTHQASGL